MNLHRIVFLFCAVIAFQAATAAPPDNGRQSAPANHAGITQSTASALARAVAPADLMIPLEVEQARKAILSLGTIDPDSKQLEQDYPGIWAAVWEAIEPDLRKFVAEDYPAFWAELEQLYKARLSEREGQGLLKFYQSPSGQKLLRSYLGNVGDADLAPVLADMVKSDTGNIDAGQLGAIMDPARMKAVKSMGPEDEPSLLALMASIEMDKFKQLGVETNKLTMDWVNRADPVGEDKLGKLMEAAAERFMDQHPLKK